MMSRRITIDKYQGNTHWSVEVEDSYGKLHHLGYYKLINEDVETVIYHEAEEIWDNEVEPREDLLGNAIAECVKMDIDRGVEPSLD